MLALRTYYKQKLDGRANGETAFNSEQDDETQIKNAIDAEAIKIGNNLETDFIATQKKLDAISLLSTSGDPNDPIFLRKELSRSLFLLANESIDKERVE